MSETPEDLLKNAKSQAWKCGCCGMPDYYACGKLAEEAGNLYKSQMRFSEASDALIQAGEYYELEDNYACAGRAFEEAADLLIRQSKLQSALDLMEKAQINLRTGGKGDRAARMLTNCGKNISQTDPALAVNVLKSAMEIYYDDDNLPFADDSFKYYAVALYRCQNWAEALKELPRRIEIAKKLKRSDTVNKTVLTMVIIALSQNNVNEANQILAQYGDDGEFAQSQDCQLAGMLVSAFLLADNDSLAQVVKRHYLTFLPIEIFRLVKNLHVKEVEEDTVNDADGIL